MASEGWWHYLTSATDSTGKELASCHKFPVLARLDRTTVRLGLRQSSRRRLVSQ
jgi:hypothetical protein